MRTPGASCYRCSTKIGTHLEKRMARAPTGHRDRLTDYWPLPWYLRDYKKVGYYSKSWPPTTIIIGSTAQEEQLKQLRRSYVLVPSARRMVAMTCVPALIWLYVRKDVAK